MSTVKVNAAQIGQSVTATNNFTWYQPASPDGTVRLGNGNSGSVTDLVTLTSAGNLGLGVTPSAWDTARRVLQIGGNGAFWGQSSGSGFLFLSNNNYYDGTNSRYLNTAAASRFDLASDGSFRWNTAPSGTAGNAISFTQAMTLDASGNLHVPGGGGITQNEAFGTGALKNNTTGAYNIAAGYLAAGGASAITGSYNVIVGANSALSLTSGVQNVFVGYGCGINLATGSNNIYIGDENIASGAAVSNEIVIGQGITGKGSNTAYLKGSSGVYNSANTSTWATTSDQRIKENIKPIAEGLSVINALNPVNFDYKESGKNEDGFIAQDYQTVLPQQIVTHAPSEAEKEWVDEEVLGIQQNLIPFLVAAIKELSAEIETLKQRIK